MAKEKQFVKEITDMNEDFPRWFTDVVIKTELVDYGHVKGIIEGFSCFCLVSIVSQHDGNTPLRIRYLGKYSDGIKPQI